jgi:hypothetical protein
VNILRQRVQQGIITSEAQLQAAYRQLSMHIHPDSSGLHPSHFALLQTDRDAALELLRSLHAGAAAPAPAADPGESVTAAAGENTSGRTGSFWPLFSRYIALGYPREAAAPDRFCLEVITAAGGISARLAAAVAMISDAGRRPMGRELDVMPAHRAFYLGVENLIRFRERRDRRSGILAADFLGEVIRRVREKYYCDSVALYPAALLLLYWGLREGRGEAEPDAFGELEALADLRWKLTVPANSESDPPPGPQRRAR